MNKLWIASPFFKKRGKFPLDMIVIHHIGSDKGNLYSLKGAISWFTDKEVHRNKTTRAIENQVSAHYIIPRNSYIGNDMIHLVRNADVAYHAGFSQWTVNGVPRQYINNYSIGIELEGDGNFVEYTYFQYEILAELVKDLMANYNIPEKNIVGHEDISPGRKIDPGKLFDWKKFRTEITKTVVTVSPPPIPSTPAVVTSPDIAPTEPVFFMESGENKTGKPPFSFFRLLTKILFRK
jgi:N-acetyl-anhydromuramyl-L-alanine amidase AmpD